MKKRLKNVFYVAFVALVYMTSCKKDQSLVQNENTKDPVSLKNGMLVFRDTLAFHDYYSKLLRANGINSNALVQNFVSYKAIFDKAQEEFSNISTQTDLDSFLKKNSNNIIYNRRDSSLLPKYSTSTLMSFINSNGQFMIGNQLQLITSRDYITIDNPTSSKIESVLTNLKSNVDKGIVVRSKIMSTNAGQSVMSVQNPVPIGLLNEATFYNEDGKRRLFVQTWNEYIPSYNKVHLVVAMFQQKKGTFGGWSNNETDLYFNNLTAFGTFFLGPPYLPTMPYGIPSPLAYTWQNTTGPVYYELPLVEYNGGTVHPLYNNLFNINIQGHFFSGGVPNTVTYSFLQN